MTTPQPPVHVHVPVQHDDGKQPWCDTCGYNSRNLVPLRVYDRKRNAPVA